MKRIMMVLPLAVLLAYCSGPNNTQTTTDTDMNGTSSSVSASSTGTNTSANAEVANASTSSSDISDVNTNTGTINNSTTTQPTDMGTASTNSSRAINTTSPLPTDTTDPMYQHFQRVNGQNWTWDMNYPGYDRPTAGSYNAAINGNWQLEMTPELVSAWRQDNSRSLWSSGYAYNGTYLGTGSNTYLSASESFNTRDQSNLNTQGSVQVNGSASAGTVSSNNNSASTHGLNNTASGNASVANEMNGSTSSSTTMNGSTTVTGSANANNPGASIGTNSNGLGNASSGLPGTTSGTSPMSSGSTTINGSTNVNGTITGNTGTSSTSTDLSTGSANMDVNSVNYNAANGNLYQLPKFNLYLDNGSFTGYTGCNSISGRVNVSGTSLQFLNTTPSTNIDCMGGFDQNVFLDILRRVDSYAYVGDELQLLQGNQVLLRFKRNTTGSNLQ